MNTLILKFEMKTKPPRLNSQYSVTTHIKLGLFVVFSLKKEMNFCVI